MSWRERRWGERAGGVLLVAFLLQAMLLGALGIRAVREGVLGETEVAIAVIPGAHEVDMQSLYAALRSEPYIHSVTFVPRAQALERRAAEDPDLAEVVQKSALGNPFSDAFSVTLSSATAYPALRAFASAQQWKNIIDPSFWASLSIEHSQAAAAVRFTHTAALTVGILVAVSLVALVAITVELVQRSARRRAREVRLEVLLGALPEDVFLPLVAESLTILAASLVLAGVAAWMLVALLPLIAPQSFGGMELWSLRSHLQHLLASRGPLILLCELLFLPVAVATLAFLRVRPMLRLSVPA